MGYYARVECDSLNEYNGERATTFIITFPRIVLAEVVTHRVNADGVWDEEFSVCERTTTEAISKNSASSRAIPFEKMLQKIKDDPFMPFWTLNQKGMQGRFVSDQQSIDIANREWLAARDEMINRAIHIETFGIHKQDVNRLLEPWMWVTQVVTSSRWDNFFALRCHKDAHPAFARIARMMFLARRKSTPTELKATEWHLPFIRPEEKEGFKWLPPIGDFLYDKETKYELPLLIKKSAARCAWVSYENHDKQADDEAHIKTFDRLMSELPVHASPVEHQLTPMHPAWDAAFQGRVRSNIKGYLQARKLIRHEEIVNYNPTEDEIASWGLEP